MTHVLQVGGNSDWVILKQVVRLREKTGSGLAADRRKESYGDPGAGGQGPREKVAGTQGREMGTQREGYRDPGGAGTQREGDRDPEGTGTQREGDGDPEWGDREPQRPRQGELKPRDRTSASDLEQGRSPACRWCW